MHHKHRKTCWFSFSVSWTIEQHGFPTSTATNWEGFFFIFRGLEGPQESHKAAANLWKQHIINDQKESVLTPRHMLCVEYWCRGFLVHFFFFFLPKVRRHLAALSYCRIQSSGGTRQLQKTDSIFLLDVWKFGAGWRVEGSDSLETMVRKVASFLKTI